MKLGYIIVYVPDVLQTVVFYETAFGLHREFVHEGGDYAELATGDTRLAFAAESLRAANGIEALDNRPSAKPAGIEIALVTPDVQAAYDTAISAGAAPLRHPDRKPWGQTVAYVRDPNGCLIEICSPVGP